MIAVYLGNLKRRLSPVLSKNFLSNFIAFAILGNDFLSKKLGRSSFLFFVSSFSKDLPPGQTSYLNRERLTMCHTE